MAAGAGQMHSVPFCLTDPRRAARVLNAADHLQSSGIYSLHIHAACGGNLVLTHDSTNHSQPAQQQQQQQ